MSTNKQYPNAPLAFSIPKFAEQVGVSKSYIYHLIKEGRGPNLVKIGTRSLIIAEDGLLWLHSFRETPDSDDV